MTAMPATLQERYDTHVEARRAYDAKVEAIDEEYSELYDKVSDEVHEARTRRDQLDLAHRAALKEAQDEYKETTGVDPF